MTSVKRFAAAGAAGAAMLGTLALPAVAGADHVPTQSYSGTLGELNDSGTTGTVSVERDGTTVTVEMTVTGASAEVFHAQHIHGALGVSNACPTLDETDTANTLVSDADEDGFISVAEGGVAYGGIQSTLALADGDFSPAGALTGPFPTADAEGNYTYSETFEIQATDAATAEEIASDLGNLHVVVHGITDADPTTTVDDAEVDNDPAAYDGDKPSSLTPDTAPGDEGFVPFEITVPAACGGLSLDSINLTDTYADATGDDGVIVRNFLVLLDREPDAEGFEYWQGEMADGASLEDLAWSIAQGDEFKARFPDILSDDVTDEEYVQFVYTAVFERSADAEGLAYWVGELNADNTDRVAMLVYFAASQEFKNVTSTS